MVQQRYTYTTRRTLDGDWSYSIFLGMKHIDTRGGFDAKEEAAFYANARCERINEMGQRIKDRCKS